MTPANIAPPPCFSFIKTPKAFRELARSVDVEVKIAGTRGRPAKSVSNKEKRGNYTPPLRGTELLDRDKGTDATRRTQTSNTTGG